MIIAGAGIIGLACAWRLAQRGVRVTIFDAREVAREASWAGAGMLAPGGEVDTASELASLAVRSLSAYPQFLEELRAETGATIDFQPCGAFELATTDAECKALEIKAERQRSIGVESEPCTYHGFNARFYPGDATVDPRQTTAALRKACENRHVELRENEPVIEVSPDGLWVRTAGATVPDPDGVIVAAGAWSSQLCACFPRTKPVRGHLLSWELPPRTLPSILRHCHTYLLQRGYGTLIAGSSTEDAGFDRTVDTGIVADIRERASALLPALQGIPPSACWNGFRPEIPVEPGQTHKPLIGQTGSKLWAAFGHYRNGILLAPETARLIAESVAHSL